MPQALLIGCISACLALTACEGTRTGDRDPAPDGSRDAGRPTTSALVGCPDPTPVDLSATPLRRIEVDPASLDVGPPSRVPWTEYAGNPEEGQVERMHVGRRVLPLRSEGYLREVSVWSNGVVWFSNVGFRFLGFDGTQTRVRGVPAWYDRLAWAEDQVYFAVGSEVRTVSADDLEPRTLLDAASVVDVPDDIRPSKVRVRVAGSLSPDNPVWQLRYRLFGPVTRSPWTTSEQGGLPLDPAWDLLAAHGLYLGHDPRGRTWAAFDPRAETLWCHTFHDRGRKVDLLLQGITPGGRHLVLRASDRHALVLDATTGRPRYRYRIPPQYFGSELEGDGHLVLTAYDGPPNPRFDPGDAAPEPAELTWDNLVVRCSFRGRCERAGRVDSPQRSVVLGDTFLFTE